MSAIKKERYFWMIFGLVMVVLLTVIFLLENMVK